MGKLPKAPTREDFKKPQELNESSENLNISDVSDSEKFKDLYVFTIDTFSLTFDHVDGYSKDDIVEKLRLFKEWMLKYRNVNF